MKMGKSFRRLDIQLSLAVATLVALWFAYASLPLT